MLIIQALAGLVIFHLVAWLASAARDAVPWRLVAVALVTQFLLAAVLTRLPIAHGAFDAIAILMQGVQGATNAGTQFVFGYLAGAEPPFEVTRPNAGFVLALQALPVIIVMSALARILTYWGVLPLLITGIRKLLSATFGIGGALGLAAGANLFVGMIEAPLLVRPYLRQLDRGELLALMSCGLATIAGTVFVLYANLLGPVLPDAPGHLLTASLMSLPAALALSVIVIPPHGGAAADAVLTSEEDSTFDALAAGTRDGLGLFFNVAAMLLVLVALVHLVNLGLGVVEIGGAALTLERMLGWLLAPVCWLLGVPGSEASAAGALLGTKIVLNELIAYVDLGQLDSATLSERSTLIMSYALCGFANLGSMGMLVGALVTMVPERRADVVALGVPALVIGVAATCVTGAVVGLLHP